MAGDEVQHGKPAPDMFLLAAGGSASRRATCIVVEDSPTGVRGGARRRHAHDRGLPRPGTEAALAGAHRVVDIRDRRRDPPGRMIATAVSSVVTDGKCRRLPRDRPAREGGIELRLLPDRGLDAGDAWFAGVPLDWTLAGRRDRAGRRRLDAVVRRRADGHVRAAQRRRAVEGHGQHGDYTFQRADVEAVERSGDALIVQGAADLRGRRARAPPRGRAHVADARRPGPGPARGRRHQPRPDASPALQLYHVNLGPPLWAEGAELRPRRPRHPPARRRRGAVRGRLEPRARHAAGAPERVFEHEVAAGPRRLVQRDRPRRGPRGQVRWDAATMPRMWQWVHPAPVSGCSGSSRRTARCSASRTTAPRAGCRSSPRRGAPDAAGDPRPPAVTSGPRCVEVSSTTRCTRDRLLPRALFRTPASAATIRGSPHG